MALYDVSTAEKKASPSLVAGSRKTNIYRCNSFAEYEALPAAEKAKYDYVATPEDINTYSYLTCNQDWIGNWATFDTTERKFYTFTVPYSGKYKLHSSLMYNIDNTSTITVNVRFYNYTKAQVIHKQQIASYGYSRHSIGMDCIVELNAGDRVALLFSTEGEQEIRWLQIDNLGDYWQYLG